MQNVLKTSDRPDEKRTDPSTRDELARLLIRHVKAGVAHDMQAAIATLHEDCVVEDMPTGRTFYGRAEAETYYREWWWAFGFLDALPDGRRSYWADDGTYIAESRYRGKHVGSFLKFPPTSRDVEVRFAVFVSFKDGLMLGERFYYDLAGILRQIGVIEFPPTLALQGRESNGA